MCAIMDDNIMLSAGVPVVDDVTPLPGSLTFKYSTLCLDICIHNGAFYAWRVPVLIYICRRRCVM